MRLVAAVSPASIARWYSPGDAPLSSCCCRASDSRSLKTDGGHGGGDEGKGRGEVQGGEEAGNLLRRRGGNVLVNKSH